MLVLEDAERAERARRRGARRAPRLRRDLRRPPPDRAGAERAATRRARSSSRSPTPAVAADEVDYVNAHGTSTPLNDRTETEALKLALGERGRRGPGLLDQVGDRPPARRRRGGRGDRHGRGAATRGRPADGRLGASATPSSTSTTSPARRGRSSAARTAPAPSPWSRSRTRSASAATTRSSASPHEHARRQRAPPQAGWRPVERLEPLCDPRQLRRRCAPACAPPGSATAPGPATASSPAPGRVGGRPVFCYAQDPAFMGGSLGAAHADSIVRVLRARRRGRRPGGRLRRVGRRPAAGGPRRARRLRAHLPRQRRALADRVPQISVVGGVSAGGGAYSPALTDFVVMTESARMFLTGPKIVEAALGEQVSMEDLGGPGGALAQRRLPAGRRRRPRRGAPGAPAARPCCRRASAARRRSRPRPPPGARGPVAAGPRRRRARSTTCARSRAAIADEEQPARALRRLGAQHGHRAGADRGPARSASSPTSRAPRRRDRRRRGREGGALRQLLRPLRHPAGGARRHARASCPARGQERAGVIRHGASLLRAFAGARVPKLTVVLRKAYGGAVITMNSRDLGADIVFAWPARRDRDHGRAPGGRDRPPPPARRRERRRRRPAAPSSRTPTRPST